MRGTGTFSVQCQSIVFGTTKTASITLFLCGALIACFGLTGKASAQAPITVESSRAPEPVVPANFPLELRGILLNDTGSFFGFYNLKNGRSTWVALGQPMDGFVVRTHDEGSDLITAEFEGHTFTMALKKTTKVENGLTSPPQSLAKGNEAVRSELLNRKILRLRAQKSRLQKILAK